MSSHFYLVSALMFIPFIAAFQTVIKGTVHDKENNKRLEGVVITILDEQDEVLAYDVSTAQGLFSLTAQIPGKHIMLSSRLLGYKEELLMLENISKQIDIYMIPTSIELKEVVIKSRPINVNEDTIRYSVSAFKSAGDRTIGDVLKNLPGVEVNKSGGISYKGESINKFYVEGLDLLQNRYGIATNNVPADAVLNVEVIENHQPINSIREMVASSQAAVNLKLKSNKMARPVGGVRAGGGYSDELNWLLETFMLHASRKKQTMAMYKTNNTGNNISVELTKQNVSVKELQETGIVLRPMSLRIIAIFKF